MKKNLIAFAVLASMVTGLTGCGQTETNKEAPSVNLDYLNINLDEGNSEITANLKVITHRTDLVNTVFADYEKEFQKLYPNIDIEFEGITNYEGDMTTRLSSGDWGDICMIPATVNKSELSMYFEPIADYDDISSKYEFMAEKMYDGKVYGIPSMGNVMGVIYNKAVWESAGITESPSTPEEFIDDLKKIKENTDAIPLYTNYSAGWTLTAWDAYIGGTATGDEGFMNNTIVHTSSPFSKKDDSTGPYAVYNTLYEAVANGLTEDDPTTTDWEGSKSRMNNGEIATMVLGNWAVSQVKSAGENPDDIAYMPFPITVNGQQYATTNADYMYGINVNSSADEKQASAIFIKWLTEKSGYAFKQGGVPAVKGAEYPDVLSDFSDVKLVIDSPAPAGEEDLFAKINNESELSLNADYTHVARIIESAIDHSETMEEIAQSWNDVWTSAQESNNVTVN